MNLKKILSLLALSAISLTSFISCDESDSDKSSSTDYIGIQSTLFAELPEGATQNVEAKIYASNASSVDRTFDLVIVPVVVGSENLGGTTADPAYFSVPATVTIPAGSREGLIQIGVTGIGLESVKEITLSLAPQAGVNFGIVPSIEGEFNTITAVAYPKLRVFLSQQCLLNKLTIEIVTDAYGTETSWELYDGDLVLVASAGPFQDLAASGTFAQTPVSVCVADGNYTFVAYDAFGDGMDSGSGAGYYRLVKFDENGTPIEIAKNGVFATDDIVEFSLP